MDKLPWGALPAARICFAGGYRLLFLAELTPLITRTFVYVVIPSAVRVQKQMLPLQEAPDTSREGDGPEDRPPCSKGGSRRLGLTRGATGARGATARWGLPLGRCRFTPVALIIFNTPGVLLRCCALENSEARCRVCLGQQCPGVILFFLEGM